MNSFDGQKFKINFRWDGCDRIQYKLICVFYQALGKTARVMHVYSDGDLRVQILEDDNKQIWTVNPDCVILVQRYPVPEQSDPTTQVAVHGGPVAENKPPATDKSEMRLLMSKVAQGNLEYVKELYETDKSIVSVC